jgi:hypothetical protein
MGATRAQRGFQTAMFSQLKIENRPIWERKRIAGYKEKMERGHYYGDEWVILSQALRRRYKRCLWCDKPFVQKQLQVHHAGCVKFNPDHIHDERILLVVCDACHVLLEPWSRINLSQMLPQLYE